MSSDLARRIAFTLGALLVYRLGAHIPLPGIALRPMPFRPVPSAA